jgi:hypothetical protein
MREYLRHLRTREHVLSPELSRVLAEGFVEENGCVLIATEAPDSPAARTVAQDETGYECFINHLHVKNLAEALEFARRLNGALVKGFTGRFIVIVSFDGSEATVRFHKHRTGQAWLNNNLEAYGEEGIAVIDSD